jgi:hypothetical protein
VSTRYNNGSHYENHQRAAELHDLAAHAHRTATENQGKQDHQTGQEHSREALEHSQAAHQRTMETHAQAANQQGIIEFGHKDIAALAHQLWVERGCPEGSPEEDWFQAVEKLRIAAAAGKGRPEPL